MIEMLLRAISGASGRLLSAVLDPTIVLSFGQTGYAVHGLSFDPRDLDVDLDGKVTLVTGANAGLGYATAYALAARGASVYLVCRNRGRAESAAARIRTDTGNVRVFVEVVDVSSQRSIRDFVRRFRERKVDVLVNNAGVLPAERSETAEGIELTFATNVVGPFLLTRALLPKLFAASASRVVNVTSGGMYAQRLELTDWDWSRRPFDGVRAYALTKRAEVVLTELLAERLASCGVVVNSVHPGWADTPGVAASLPRFRMLAKPLLRDATSGADTVVWLAVCERIVNETGKLWFDREARSTHFVPWTRESEAERRQLWRLCCELAGVPEMLAVTPPQRRSA